jgi:hypothetical protein
MAYFEAESTTVGQLYKAMRELRQVTRDRHDLPPGSPEYGFALETEKRLADEVRRLVAEDRSHPG